jgi:hypothetical protein
MVAALPALAATPMRPIRKPPADMVMALPALGARPVNETPRGPPRAGMVTEFDEVGGVAPLWPSAHSMPSATGPGLADAVLLGLPWGGCHSGCGLARAAPGRLPPFGLPPLSSSHSAAPPCASTGPVPEVKGLLGRPGAKGLPGRLLPEVAPSGDGRGLAAGGRGPAAVAETGREAGVSCCCGCPWCVAVAKPRRDATGDAPPLPPGPPAWSPPPPPPPRVAGVVVVEEGEACAPEL